MTALLNTPATTRPRLRRVVYEPAPGEAPLRAAPAPAHPAPTARPPAVDPPAAREPITRLLRLACEVLDGRRPLSQLAAHADESVLRCWRVTAARRPVRRSPARFRRVRLCHPHPDAAEVAVTVELDGGVRALAARFERHGERWRWTAVRIG
ncbi:Rv3235 family protein [Pseudonocardia saturnea]